MFGVVARCVSSFDFKLICLSVRTDKWSSHLANISVLASENSVAIVSLVPVTSYQVRMFAVNSLGHSEPSDVITVQSAEETPGGPPLHIKAVASSTSQIKVRIGTLAALCIVRATCSLNSRVPFKLPPSDHLLSLLC